MAPRNSLLSIVNERVFDNGPDRVWVPLRCLVCASNEVPETEETTGHVWRDVGDVWGGGGDVWGENGEMEVEESPQIRFASPAGYCDTYEKGCDI